MVRISGWRRITCDARSLAMCGTMRMSLRMFEKCASHRFPTITFLRVYFYRISCSQQASLPHRSPVNVCERFAELQSERSTNRKEQRLSEANRNRDDQREIEANRSYQREIEANEDDQKGIETNRDYQRRRITCRRPLLSSTPLRSLWSLPEAVGSDSASRGARTYLQINSSLIGNLLRTASERVKVRRV